MLQQPPRKKCLQHAALRHELLPPWQLPPLPRSPLLAMQARLRYPGTRATKTKHQRDERVQKKTMECGQDVSLSRLTQIRHRMFWWTKVSVSCSILSAVATCEHIDSASSPTCLQLMCGGGKVESLIGIVQMPLDLRHSRTRRLGPDHL
jgi:hypothetical protein